MSEWVSDIELTSKLGYKILIAGLSEAGKTAVKRIFFLKQRTEDVDSLSATINYERMSVTIRDTPITIVDLGGQKIFLKRFLSGFSPFVFSSVKVLIFLIDVANKTSRNNATQYFSACLKRIATYSTDAEIFVFLHKNDLVIDSPNYDSIHEQLKEQFQLEHPKPLRFFRTTIYKPESVIDSFGRIIELVIPEIAESEFVEGRKIGEIEEFHETGITLQRSSAVETNQVVGSVTPKIAGDPVVLSKLQHLMKSAIKTNTDTSSQGTVFLGNAAEEEATTSETTLMPVKVSQEPSSKHLVEEMANAELESLSTPTGRVEPVTPAETGEEFVIKQESVQVNPRISQFVEFFRLDVDKATEIVENGHDRLFEMAAKIGVEIPILVDIFLKYLPFIKKSQGEKKLQNITEDRLLQLFGAYLKAKLKEQDIVKCLVFMAERTNMHVEEILDKYLFPEKKKEEVKKVEEIIKEKPAEVAQINIPIEAESIGGIITIPNIDGLGFKIDLVDDGLNANISFLLLGPVGQKELIGNAKVSSKITVDEIRYLLSYELNMPNLGFSEDGVGSIFFAAKMIHESLRKLHESTLKSTKEVITKKVRKEKGYLAETINFVIPIEIEVDGRYVMLSESEKLAFTVDKAKRGFLISFIQRGFPIGQVNVIESITISQLGRLLKEEMQLPIESEAAVNFSSRVILATIKKLVEPEAEGFQQKEIPKYAPKEEDRTSEKLREYLDLLEEE